MPMKKVLGFCLLFLLAFISYGGIEKAFPDRASPSNQMELLNYEESLIVPLTFENAWQEEVLLLNEGYVYSFQLINTLTGMVLDNTEKLYAASEILRGNHNVRMAKEQTDDRNVINALGKKWGLSDKQGVQKVKYIKIKK